MARTRARVGRLVASRRDADRRHRPHGQFPRGADRATQARVRGLLWLPDRSTARYCTRPAPGRGFVRCRTVAQERNYAERNALYSKERRRVGQLVRRGRLERERFEQWKSDNRPGAWLPFAEW